MQQKERDKAMKKIKEIIVVEGRDDTIAVKQAVDAMTIETHGFGIKKETWNLIEKAYNEIGIIIFTDPDFSGEEIRRKLSRRFPDAKQAYLQRDDAEKNGDIGIENASPEAIIEALEKVHCTAAASPENPEFTMEDMVHYGLTGLPSAAEKRSRMGKLLGIGYGNTKSFLKKLNKYQITRKEFLDCLSRDGQNEGSSKDKRG